MTQKIITAVGIDVSKGKSTIAVRRPGGIIVLAPFAVKHNEPELKALVSKLKLIGGDVRIVMEHTSSYWKPIAFYLKKAGFRVSIVNAILIHDFSDNSIRKIKTDKADALKIASYALTFWDSLREYSDTDEKRQLLKELSHAYDREQKVYTILRNGLIAIIDQTFPGANMLFAPDSKNDKGHTKWVDFVVHFWHRDCVSSKSRDSFVESYHSWCKRNHYRFNLPTAEKIYDASKEKIVTLSKCSSTKALVTQAAEALNAICESIQAILQEMQSIAQTLPEYNVVMDMYGAGPITGLLLMAEIGDVRRFPHKKAIVAYAGLDAPPYQSGTFDSKSRHVSKRGSPNLRKTLFMVSSMILCNSNCNNKVYQFMDKKRAEGKHFYVYTTAGAAKFLRIYYARVRDCLNALDNTLLAQAG